MLLSAPLVLAGSLLGGCTALPAPTSTQLADALSARLAARDRAGFTGVFAPTTGAQALAARVFANLDGSGAVIASPQPDRLSVSWSLPGEPLVVSEATFTLRDGRIDAVSATSTGSEWLQQPLIVHAERSLVLAVEKPQQPARWLAAARAGLRALTAVWPAGQQRAEPLVVLAPSDLLGFGRYAGSGADATAAVTVVPGTARSAGIRVVVNPVAPPNAEADAATLTHEAVHAAMRSPRLTGTPGWLLEGIAESLTARAHPAVAATNTQAARVASGHRLPAALPEVSGDPAGYALAQVAVDALVRRVGWTAVFDEARWRSAAAGGRIDDAQVLIWYRDELARLR